MALDVVYSVFQVAVALRQIGLKQVLYKALRIPTQVRNETALTCQSCAGT